MEASPDYSVFTDSIHIAFTNEDAPGYTPAINVKVNDILIENVGLDTGSTAFALSAKLVPAFAEADKSKLTPGHIEYANKRRWDGFWFPVEVTFEGTEGNTAVSKVEILVINKQTSPKGEPENDTIHYMGIGFGYFDKDRGFTPDKNAVLAVTQCNNKPIDQSTFRHGYIMQKRSIDIGLTGKNTQSFRYTKLTAGSHSKTKWYWDRVSFALSVNDSPWVKGAALVDTGVTDMVINNPQYEGEDGPLPDGTKVAMRFPDEKTSLPEYSFTWPGNEESWLPASVEYNTTKYVAAFVNTGQNFYNKFDTLFDADKGIWGLRENSLS